MRAELFHADWRADRRTDITKLIVACHNFAYAPAKFGTYSVRVSLKDVYVQVAAKSNKQGPSWEIEVYLEG